MKFKDNLKLNKKTLKEIEEARKRIAEGKFFTEKEVEKILGL